MKILVNNESAGTDQPSAQHWPRLAGHADEWSRSLERGLGHMQIRLMAHDDAGKLIGQLPLSLVQSSLFGKFLVSQPYLNTGGVWTDEPDVALGMVDRAIELADQYKVKHLELRHEIRVAHPKLTVERTDKVHMRLRIPSSPEALLASFKSKLRSQLKKASQNPFEIQWGGEALLDEFYRVFAMNMRDLGTPVYSKGLFASILQEFANSSELCVVRLEKKTVAAALLVHYPEFTEVPSASSLRKFNSTGANMWMYWQLLQRAIERGSTVFDFGRSSLDSGTYKFKEQWGSQPSPACWQYYVRSGSPADMRPDSPNKQRMIAVWQRLPVWLTRVMGPSIVRGIP